MITLHPLFWLFLAAAPQANAPTAPSTAQQAPAKSAVTAASAAKATSDAEIAHALVASEELARGDVDGWMQRVFALLSAPHTGGALDEAALALVSQRANELNEP